MPLGNWIVEPCNGGLVNSRDPVTLAQGECADITNGIYLPNTDALVRAPGRTAWCTAVTGSGTKSVFGLLDTPFADSTHYMVLATTDGYEYTDVDAVSPTATLLEALTIGAHPQAVFAGNKYFLVDGTNTTKAFLRNATLRSVGLTPVSVPLEAQLNPATAVGAWNAGTGFFHYWWTEVCTTYSTAEGSDGVTPIVFESGFIGRPAVVKVTATTYPVQLSVPLAAVTNARTTGIRIYRGGPTTAAAENPFPDGILVGSIPTTSSLLVINDGGVVAQKFVSSATVDSAPNWNNPNNVFGAGVATVPAVRNQTETFTVKNFTDGSSLGSYVSDPVIGFTAQITSIRHVLGSVNPDSIRVWIEASPDAGTTWHRVGGEVSVGPTITTYTFGNSDVLPGGYAWQASDFLDANFRLRMRCRPANDGDAGTYNSSVELDGPIAVNVFYSANANSVGLGPYPVLSVNDVLVEKNGPPPTTSSCGAYFEDSLVLNDTTKPGRLVWSYPGEHETFPPLYFVQLPLRRNEKITAIRPVNDRLIVFTTTNTWRVNYLPTETDSPFNRTRMFELLSDTVGAVNANAVCLVPALDGRNELYFVSGSGVYATDGIVVRDLTDDIDWYGGTAAVSGFTSMADTVIGLVNDPDYRAVFMPTATGEIFVVSYADRHRKPRTGVKWSKYTGTNIEAGPTIRGTPKSMVSVTTASGVQRCFIGYSGSGLLDGGKIFRQDNVAYTDAADIPNTVSSVLGWTTRRILPAGLGAETAVNDLCVYSATPAALGNIGFTATLTTIYANKAATTESVAVTGYGVPVLQSPVTQTNGTGFQVAFVAADDSAVRVLFTAYALEGFSDGGLHR